MMAASIQIRRRIARLWRNRRGSILMEVALSVPVILILFSGGFEIGRYALLEMKVSRIATSLTDLVAQTEDEIYSADIDGLVQAVPHIGQPFSFDTSNTQVIVTSVKANSSDTPIVCWQVEKVGDLGQNSRIGNPGAVADLPDSITMKEGDTAIIAEVYYEYAPFIFDSVMSPRRLSSDAIFRPRLAKLSALQPGDQTAC